VAVFSLVFLAVIVLFDLYAATKGVTPNSLAFPWSLGRAYEIVNVPGGILVLFIGRPLAHPDNPVHTWNACVYYVGAATFWMCVGACFGFAFDWIRTRKKIGDEERAQGGS
jgi:hypothetical protein